MESALFFRVQSGKMIVSLLICTLIFENPGLKKFRSVSNLRKISGPANLNLFSVCHLDFFLVYGLSLAFFLGGDLEKKSRFAGPEIFLRFEADLDFSRPGFLEIKVQIKRPSVNWKSELTPHLQYIFVISYIFINLNLALSYRYVVNKKAKKGGRPTSRKLYMLPRGHGWWVFLSLSPTYINKATRYLCRLNIVKILQNY